MRTASKTMAILDNIGADAVPFKDMVRAIIEQTEAVGGMQLLVMAATEAEKMAWACSAKAGKRAEAKDWPGTLRYAQEGLEHERQAQQAIKYALHMEGVCMEAAARGRRCRHGLAAFADRKAKRKTYRASLLALVDALDRNSFQLGKAAEEIKEPCPSLPVLIGMARVAGRMPMKPGKAGASKRGKAHRKAA